MGHKQAQRHRAAMSALPPKADIIIVAVLLWLLMVVAISELELTSVS
jgi:hypothetical protein